MKWYAIDQSFAFCRILKEVEKPPLMAIIEYTLKHEVLSSTMMDEVDIPEIMRFLTIQPGNQKRNRQRNEFHIG